MCLYSAKATWQMWELSSKLICPIKKHTIKQIPWHSFINNPSVSIKTFLGFQTEFLYPLMAVMITVFSRNNLTFISSQEERCLLGHCVIVETSNLDWKYLNPSLFIYILSCFPPHTSVRCFSSRSTGENRNKGLSSNRCQYCLWKQHSSPILLEKSWKRTHYWVIRASDQGLQIKADGFNTLTPESQAVCRVKELSMVLLWNMSQRYQIFISSVQIKSLTHIFFS